jgi:hypothetical protein
MSQSGQLFASVGITPIGELEATAKVLGEALGGLTFVEDKSGRYDEFPAYVAEREGLRYALLGPPAPEDDLRDEATDECQLMVDAISGEAGPRSDISADLIAQIGRDGRLQSWPLD